MARKSVSLLPSNRKRSEQSWAALGADTSMSSIVVCGIGYDAVLDKMTEVSFAEVRWTADDDYFKRLGDAARADKLIHQVVSRFYVLEPRQIFIALEEPYYYSASRNRDSKWLKQMAEVSGAFKGGLVRGGYHEIHEINNSQWKAVLRKEGVEFIKGGRELSAREKKEVALANKFIVKDWVIAAYGLPDLPDLVKSKTGGKIPRPDAGYGAKAKPEQPNDVYDAAACMAFMQDHLN